MAQNLANLQAEQVVLGTILFDQHCAELVHQIAPSDFSVPEHCEIFHWICKDVEGGRKPNPMTLMPMLGEMQCGQVNGRTYIARLAAMSDRTTARECLHSVKEMAARRMLMAVGDSLRTCATDMREGPVAYSLQAIQALNDVISTGRKAVSKPQTAFEAASDLVSSLDDPDDGSLISTGLNSLDAFMGGWPRGELSIVAGRPSMGKSAVLSAIARRGAKRGVNVLMFSLEMPKRTLMARMLSDFAYSSQSDQRIPYADILKKRLTTAQKLRLNSYLASFAEYPIIVDDQRGLTMAEIQLRAMRHADSLGRKGKRLDVVMVDHIGKISASDRYRGSMVHETGEKSDSLMTLAYELDVAVVAAHQLNRNTEGREDKHPTPADLRDTGNLEQDAHTLIFPYRQAYYLERQKFDDPEKEKIRKATLEKKKNSLDILVSKCRNDACGSIEVFVDMASNHVEDLRRAA
jgi:replicative DNA helicase